ncbi:hypothetical protein FOXG_04629 [Fusarium oxysporum f. sp. lycopersici 4287]|uniref:Xaa-Pro dipeptidyl-peptidase C-terminal domain-containing protein n=1 Tax=Fusarium oxysporum f. sp. lycopersici (strain 4287 / CBS 123668 / FGSC 9935 / NRRL 34936) TaxID=426428 RepID=A0A0J9UPZ5_FUSO4|nr:hypothetical protein FOXG_04629 [Fusarium oxysporum f. sp. lycopersici 4287]KNB01365.1 hypothetical protein FOXG_04629 [Fusarium oxysporum f. sp. lycopersici 4287]
MPNKLRDIRKVDTTSYPYIYEENVSIPLSNGGVVRCNVYRPRDTEKGAQYPVIVTYGPYGKDVPYAEFNPKSYAEVDPAHKTEHSVGVGQSPGLLDILSSATIDAFKEVIEWAADKSWSTGKIGLLGISYYAVTQWAVAARHPKGLSAMVPWEGFSDVYQDNFRHGGIMSNKLTKTWFKRQVLANQYGLPGRAARPFGPDTIEGDLDEIELKTQRVDPIESIRENRYRDSPYFSRSHYDLRDITTPFLSVANWGGYQLHLRGNIQGYMHATSKFKYLRFIAGRHDLPFYYPEEVEVQRSFLDAFLKDDDRDGWTSGTKPAVDLLMRRGDMGYNNSTLEKQFPRRQENEWPIARTEYTKFFLHPDGRVGLDTPAPGYSKQSYRAGGLEDPSQVLSFRSAPFSNVLEITGHLVANINISASKEAWLPPPTDIDVFVTVRHYNKDGKEVCYTDSTGEPGAVAKGELRLSLRKTNPGHPNHREWLPYRDYYSTSVLPVVTGDVYQASAELWPTCAVFEIGETLGVEISSRDTAGVGAFGHDDPIDRDDKVLQGWNNLIFGAQNENYLLVPVIPEN